MATYYLAVDIGASSGRHILGHMENGKMILEEVYRFVKRYGQKKATNFAGNLTACLKR